jgi:hypothetical protein
MLSVALVYDGPHPTTGVAREARRRTKTGNLVRYRNQADKSLHELRTAMHHHPLNQERAINLSILPVFGPGEFSRVESN